MRSLTTGFRNFVRVTRALFLRELRFRLSGGPIGFLKFIIVPFGHLMIIVTLYTLMGRGALLGTDPAVFYVTGILPFILFLYPSRSLVIAFDEGKPLLMFPDVSGMALYTAKVLMELINSIIIIVLIGFTLTVMGNPILPSNPAKLLGGIAMCFALTFAYSLPNAVIAAINPGWMQPSFIIVLIMYLASGALFLPDSLPPIVAELMYYNPLAHVVEWIRSAYFTTYNEGVLDRSVLFFAILAYLGLGLMLERLLRAYTR